MAVPWTITGRRLAAAAAARGAFAGAAAVRCRVRIRSAAVRAASGLRGVGLGLTQACDRVDEPAELLREQEQLPHLARQGDADGGQRRGGGAQPSSGRRANRRPRTSPRDPCRSRRKARAARARAASATRRSPRLRASGRPRSGRSEAQRHNLLCSIRPSAPSVRVVSRLPRTRLAWSRPADARRAPPVAATVGSSDGDNLVDLQGHMDVAVAESPAANVRRNGRVRVVGDDSQQRPGLARPRRRLIRGLRAVGAATTTVGRVPTGNSSRGARQGSAPPARVDRTRADGGCPTRPGPGGLPQPTRPASTRPAWLVALSYGDRPQRRTPPPPRRREMEPPIGHSPGDTTPGNTTQTDTAGHQ